MSDKIPLMKRFRAALRPGGQLLIHDSSPTKTTSRASFALTMLVHTPAGDAYTFADCNRMLDQAGFGPRAIIDVPKSANRLITAIAP
jgi:hypothetical protein